jgi:hypothetical protein
MKREKFAASVSDKEFHSALQLFTGVLQIVKCMASSSGDDEMSERNRKNATVLRSYIFRHQIFELVHFGFQIYCPGRHSEQFLQDLIQFNHIFTEHMEQYSKGKMLTIKTQKRRKVKRKKHSK